MEITVTVDRIEGELAVLEVSDRLVDWPVSALPEGTTEGDVLTLTLTTASQAGADAAQQRLERLQQRAPKSDIIDL